MSGGMSHDHLQERVISSDLDYTHIVQAQDYEQASVLAHKIVETGIVSRIAKPFRIHKFGKLVITRINQIDDTEWDYAEGNQPLTLHELAQEIVKE